MDATFSPTPPDAADETDHLAGGVLRSLSRSFRNQFSLSPGRALGLAIISFGIWPLWKMSRQFRDYVTLERQQLWHVSEWLRVRRGGDSALALHDHLQAIRPRTRLRFVMAALLLVVVGVIWSQADADFSLRSLIESTYQLHRPWFEGEGPTLIWSTWVVGLFAAYSFHALRVLVHRHKVARFVGVLNRLLQREGIPTVAVPQTDPGFSQRGWWVTAVLLSCMGALWAIPMALAGAMQRRYINSTAARFRAELLERVRAMLQQHRPAVAIPNYVIHSRRCGNDRCRANLRASALFCSRCGMSADQMSEVA